MAERHSITALDLRRRTLGPHVPDVAQSLYDYAFYQLESLERVEAENLTRQAIAIHREVGLRNDATIELLSLLELILILQDRCKDAEAAGQEALAIAQEQPRQCPEVATILHRLADAAIRQGDFA
jgi:hypothetical protein